MDVEVFKRKREFPFSILHDPPVMACSGKIFRLNAKGKLIYLRRDFDIS